MKNAKTPEELISRFISKEENPETHKKIDQFIDDMRNALEHEGRISELNRMIDYHQYMADLPQTDESDKHVHMADIIVLQQRITYLESQEQN